MSSLFVRVSKYLEGKGIGGGKEEEGGEGKGRERIKRNEERGERTSSEWKRKGREK